MPNLSVHGAFVWTAVCTIGTSVDMGKTNYIDEGDWHLQQDNVSMASKAKLDDNLIGEVDCLPYWYQLDQKPNWKLQSNSISIVLNIM